MPLGRGNSFLHCIIISIFAKINLLLILQYSWQKILTLLQYVEINIIIRTVMNIVHNFMGVWYKIIFLGHLNCLTLGITNNQ